MSLTNWKLYLFVEICTWFSFLLQIVSKNKNPLTEEQLLYYLENDDDSDIPLLSDEDDQGWSDKYNDDDEDIFEMLDARHEEENIGLDHDVQAETEKLFEVVEEEVIPDILKQEIEDFVQIHGFTDKNEVEWMNNVVYETRNIKWYKPSILPDPVVALPAPIDFFMKYVPEKIFHKMVDMTNLYAAQKNIPRFSPTTVQKIKLFIGVHIAIGNLQFPRVRMYWSPKYGIPLIKESISLLRFFKLRQTVLLVDITSRPENNNDRLWKVRDIYDSIRKRCQ